MTRMKGASDFGAWVSWEVSKLEEVIAGEFFKQADIIAGLFLEVLLNILAPKSLIIVSYGHRKI
jgi:hypothetical protein